MLRRQGAAGDCHLAPDKETASDYMTFIYEKITKKANISGIIIIPV